MQRNQSEEWMVKPEIRLLIAERNPRMRDFLRREFSRRNFIVDGAATGDELFEKLETGGHVHLVVLAANTPEGWRIGLIDQIVEQYPTLPVILHTYLEDLEDSPSLRKFAAMVEKSGNPEDLARMVALVLERHYPELTRDEGTEAAHVD
jgi:DNA-binding response OmpR family regulator